MMKSTSTAKGVCVTSAW